MDWNFIARDYKLNQDLDFERNVSPKMRESDRAYPLFNKEKSDIVGWIII